MVTVFKRQRISHHMATRAQKETASGVRDTADTVAARGAHALTETSRNQTKLSESTWSELWEPV